MYRHLFLFLSVFLSLSPFSYPRNDDHLRFSANLPELHAEKLKPIVEKRLRFWTLNENGSSVEDLRNHAGYYKLPHSKDARMFYYFFESRNSKNDPLVIWVTGVAGCSSELALFYENGPFHITESLSLVQNEYGWDKASNLLFVDQPIGAGFSYSSDESDIRDDEEGVSNDFYDFLQAFFAEHPQFAKNDFYITGQSYGGHYIPAFASRVQQGNKAKEGVHINLKGFAIGNGLTNPEIHFKSYPDFALDAKLINQSDYDSINTLLQKCEEAIKSCGSDGGSASCLNVYFACSDVYNTILKIAGNINYYDIRKKCEGGLCYNFSNLEAFLKQNSVRDALGVGDREFQFCSPAVYSGMVMNWMSSHQANISAFLEDGIRVLIYAGEYDLICNWLGNSRWVHEIKWSGQKEFVAEKSVPFLVDGAEAGLLKSHGPLAFLKVHNAGHLVPMDQPKAALQMLTTWLQGKLKYE